jgi:hypothetical protein
MYALEYSKIHADIFYKPIKNKCLLYSKTFFAISKSVISRILPLRYFRQKYLGPKM